jgi:hypothetical protein
MKPAVARWLEFAEIDLKAARALLKEGSHSQVVCFHAQQSIEKSLKALIESKGLNPPKSHDLIMLYGHVESMGVPQRSRSSGPRSAGQPEGPRDAGGFFWFVFLSAQENEHSPMGVATPGLAPGSPSKFLSEKNTARRGKILFMPMIFPFLENQFNQQNQ